MEKYKSALDKITLRQPEKEKAKALFRQADLDRRMETAERRNIMRFNKFLRPAAVVAAGLVLVLGGNAVIAGLSGTNGDIPNKTSGNSSTKVTESVNATSLPKTENRFSVIAYAKKLSKGGRVFPDTYTSHDYVLYDTIKKEVMFAFDFPVECKGENIDTITYRIDRGAFQVDNAAGCGVVIDGEKVPSQKWIQLYHSNFGQDMEEEQYKSFTVKYDNQTNDKLQIVILDSWANWSEERFKQYKAFDYKLGEDDDKKNKQGLEKTKKVYNFLTQDMGITCTVTYKDGTTETKNIEVSNEIVKVADVFPEDVDAFDSKEDVVRCFSIK